MKTWNTLRWTMAGALLMSQAGCHHHHKEKVVVEEQKTVVVEQQPEPVYAEQQAPPPVIVQEAPPAAIVETRPPQPAGVFVWVGGYWHWDSHRYVWVGGRWAHPPQARAVWVAPRYERFEHGYRYHQGHWR